MGQLTLYSDVGNGASSQQQTIQDSLETDMNAGTFNDVQKDIVRVTYVDLLPRTDQGSSGANNGGAQETRVQPQNSMVRVGLFLAAGFLVAVLVGVALNRRRKSATEEDAETHELGEQNEVL